MPHRPVEYRVLSFWLWAWDIGCKDFRGLGLGAWEFIGCKAWGSERPEQREIVSLQSPCRNVVGHTSKP